MGMLAFSDMSKLIFLLHFPVDRKKILVPLPLLKTIILGHT